MEDIRTLAKCSTVLKLHTIKREWGPLNYEQFDTAKQVKFTNINTCSWGELWINACYLWVGPEINTYRIIYLETTFEYKRTSICNANVTIGPRK